MNRNFHRIIFNAARGLRMVVQETARSTGRGARRATRGGAGASLGVAAALAALATSSPHAQIAADRGAPGTQRPTVLTAPNGVPLVNIQAPSVAGVSRNAYRQFDVGANGVVLNNSRTSVQSQLGGYVQGNPWLARGSARVIVNEVNSSNPTYLRGFVEVAGPRADVIIANPSGISINGGGFINAYRATLTTGAPQYGASGSLEGYVVRGGTVSIDGTGLDAGTTDSLAILARAFALSGALHAPALRVVAGANRIDADLAGIVPIAGTGAAPAYAIDVAHLGGMYAGHIALVVNEAGVGARNAGTIQTATGRYTLAGSGPGVGQLTLSASGRLENSGVIQAASDIAIDAAGLANSGTVQGAAALRIATQGDLANHVGTTGGTLEAARLDLASATGDIDNRGGTVRQASAAALTLTAGHLSNTGAGFVGAPPVPIAAATGPGTSASSGGNATVPAAGSGGGAAGGTAVAGASAGTSSTGSAAPAPAVVAPGSLTAAGGILNDGGKVHAGGDIVLRTPVVDNAGGVLDVASMALSGPAFNNAGGTLAVARGFTADVAGFDNTGGTLRAGMLAIATTGDLGNRGGTLASADAASLSVGGRLDNTGGTVSAVGALKATSAGALDNTSGRLLANAALAVTAGSLDNTLGAVRSAGGAATLDVAGRIANDRGHIDAATDLALSAGALANGGPGGGTIRAGRDGAIAVAGLFDNGNGSLTAGRHATIAAGSLASAAGGVLGAGVAADGSPAGPGDLSVTTGGDLSVNGTAIAAGRLALRGADIDLTGAQVRGADIALAAAAGDVTTRRATVATPGTLSIAATGSADAALVNEAGTLSAGRLDVQASNLRNTAGGRLAQTGGEALALGVAGTLDNTGGLVAGNGVDLALSGRRIVNAGGVIEHAGAGKDAQQREILSTLTLGAGAASSVIALASVGPTLLTWALTNPEKAIQVGLISAETGAGIVSGAITPTSVADGLGQNVGRVLNAAERVAAQELAATLKAVAQQRVVLQQEQRVGELTRLFSKQSSANSITIGGKNYTATAESNIAGTTKVFDTTGVPAANLEKQIFSYVGELTGGQPFKAVDQGVWTANLADGTTINVRSVSSSGVGRWTVDVRGSLANQNELPKYEIKLK